MSRSCSPASHAFVLSIVRRIYRSEVLVDSISLTVRARPHTYASERIFLKEGKDLVRLNVFCTRYKTRARTRARAREERRLPTHGPTHPPPSSLPPSECLTLKCTGKGCERHAILRVPLTAYPLTRNRYRRLFRAQLYLSPSRRRPARPVSPRRSCRRSLLGAAAREYRRLKGSRRWNSRGRPEKSLFREHVDGAASAGRAPGVGGIGYGTPARYDGDIIFAFLARESASGRGGDKFAKRHAVTRGNAGDKYRWRCDVGTPVYIYIYIYRYTKHG